MTRPGRSTDLVPAGRAAERARSQLADERDAAVSILRDWPDVRAVWLCRRPPRLDKRRDSVCVKCRGFAVFLRSTEVPEAGDPEGEERRVTIAVWDRENVRWCNAVCPLK